VDALAKGEVLLPATCEIEALSRMDVLWIGVCGEECRQDLLAFANQLPMPFNILACSTLVR
jgi:hypothetical protein